MENLSPGGSLEIGQICFYIHVLTVGLRGARYEYYSVVYCYNWPCNNESIMYVSTSHSYEFSEHHAIRNEIFRQPTSKIVTLAETILYRASISIDQLSDLRVCLTT